MQLLEQISESLQQGDDEKASQLTREAIKQGISAKDILDIGLISGMGIVGERFKAHEIFLPDVLMAAKAMYAGMAHIKPMLIEEGIPSIGRVVIGSVQGDLHDIGKNLVGIMLKGAGFDVIDLGNDVAPERFVEAAREHSAAVVGMSALLTTTMPVMGRVVEILKEQKLNGKVKTIVGGAPVSEAFAGEIGADAFGFDAANAIDRVKLLVASS